MIPGTDGRPGVHALRTLDDALAVRAALEAGAQRVVVVGAGFIGAEVAASCRELGVDVTMVEPLPAPLARVLGPEMGRVVGRAPPRARRRPAPGHRCVDAIDGSAAASTVSLTDDTIGRRPTWSWSASV